MVLSIKVMKKHLWIINLILLVINILLFLYFTAYTVIGSVFNIAIGRVSPPNKKRCFGGLLCHARTKYHSPLNPKTGLEEFLCASLK